MKGPNPRAEQDNRRCVFCEDLDVKFKGKNSLWIADLQVSTAFVSRNQICRGYTILVYSKAHVTELFQLEKEDLIAYSEDLAKMGKAVRDAFHPQRINYELLGNVVPHLHWHIIPRQKTDPLDAHWPIWGKDYKEIKLSDDKYRQVADKLRLCLSGDQA